MGEGDGSWVFTRMLSTPAFQYPVQHSPDEGVERHILTGHLHLIMPDVAFRCWHQPRWVPAPQRYRGIAAMDRPVGLHKHC